MKYLLIAFLIFGAVLVPSLSFADHEPGHNQLNLGDASEIENIGGTISDNAEDQVRSSVTSVLRTAISYLALAATVVIVIAGIMLIVGMGSEDSMTKAKTIILYTAIGLLIVLLAGAIVSFFIEVGDAVT